MAGGERVALVARLLSRDEVDLVVPAQPVAHVGELVSHASEGLRNVGDLATRRIGGGRKGLLLRGGGHCGPPIRAAAPRSTAIPAPAARGLRIVRRATEDGPAAKPLRTRLVEHA